MNYKLRRNEYHTELKVFFKTHTVTVDWWPMAKTLNIVDQFTREGLVKNLSMTAYFRKLFKKNPLWVWENVNEAVCLTTYNVLWVFDKDYAEDTPF